MKYTILSTRTSRETLITNVEYDFDGENVTVDVSHFQPQSAQDIAAGIENRAATEKRRLEAAVLCAQLVGEIQTGVEVPLEVE